MDCTGYIKRYFFLILGLFFMGLGISLVTKSILGTPPISSIPYVLCHAVPVTFGELTFALGMVFLLAEILIVGKDFPKHQYLQVFVALFLGVFVDIGMFLSAPVHPDYYAIQVFVLLLGCAVLALGIYVQVAANVIMNPGEGVVKAIAGKAGVRFGIIKIIFDTSLVCTAIIISFVLFGNVVGIREGTLISMLLVGYIVLVYGRVLGSLHFEKWLAE
ncbi:MAG TPA: DUF6198 family protein [Methanoregula sp.]|nr:DUF6198 family protein [Methanoregula sp.]